MAGYILKRIAFAIPTLFVVSIGIFLMVRLLPGDIIDILFGGDQTASEEVKQQAREQLDLNGSYAEQYWRWISGILQGDFGFSLRNTEPVSNIILESLTVTLELVILALLIAIARRRAARHHLCRQARQRCRLRRAGRRPGRASASPASGWPPCCCCSRHASSAGFRRSPTSRRWTTRSGT